MDRKCDYCREPLTHQYVDGKTRDGVWAYMCGLCYLEHGTGLGVGRGQLYVNKGNGFEKVKAEYSVVHTVNTTCGKVRILGK